MFRSGGIASSRVRTTTGRRPSCSSSSQATSPRVTNGSSRIASRAFASAQVSSVALVSSEFVHCARSFSLADKSVERGLRFGVAEFVD